MRRYASALMIATFLCAAGCGQQSGDQDKSKPLGQSKRYAGSYPIKAIGTTGMVADLVRNVGGKHVKVQQLFVDDTDPHTYAATDADTGKLASSEIIFYSGLHLEGKMTEIFDSLSRKMPCIGVADQLDRALIHKDDEGALDPHVWFDVTIWSKAAGVVRDSLVQFDPKNADDYKANCTRYQAELAELHEYAKKRLLEIPEKQRLLVTSHDAFEYFGRAYGIEVKAPQGISTLAEANVGDISQLVKYIVDRKAKAIFVESSVNPRNMNALIEGCANRQHKVVIGGELFSDAMGKEGTPQGTYIGMIRHNVDTIVNALK